jgi:hypothetical protein
MFSGTGLENGIEDFEVDESVDVVFAGETRNELGLML